ncbi:hypothetical protein [Cupriavidus basilensis]
MIDAEIRHGYFDRAESYLVRWRGRLEGMPGGTKCPAWRDRRIKAIHARCKELDCDRWRVNYMREGLRQGVVIDLSSEEIGKLYRAVMDRMYPWPPVLCQTLCKACPVSARFLTVLCQMARNGEIGRKP